MYQMIFFVSFFVRSILKMSFNRAKYEYFFPSKVFRCACLGQIIDNCRDNGLYSFTEIVDKLNSNSFFDNDDSKIFSVKCGELNSAFIFVCEKHLGIVIFAKKTFSCTDNPQPVNTTISYNDGKKETYCIGCIKHYLKLMYNYFYHVNFDLKSS